MLKSKINKANLLLIIPMIFQLNGCGFLGKQEPNIIVSNNYCHLTILLDKDEEEKLSKFKYVRANATTALCECEAPNEEAKKQCWNKFNNLK